MRTSRPARDPAPGPRDPGGGVPVRELLLLDAESPAELRCRVASVIRGGVTTAAQLAGAAGRLGRELSGGPVRAAIVSSPGQSASRLARLLGLIDDGVSSRLDVTGGVFLGRASHEPRIGFLFPGQGSGRSEGGGAIARRFAVARSLYPAAGPQDRSAAADLIATSAAQPRIVRSSVAGLRVLTLLGIHASAAAGHSLGELTALHWAGAIEEAAVIDLARRRGQIMEREASGGGAMAAVSAGPAVVRPLAAAGPAVIAGYNGPAQTVVSGSADAVKRVREAAATSGIGAVAIPVSDAFHSPAMAPAARALRKHLASCEFGPVARRVVSTVTGRPLPAGADLKSILVRQLCEPVLFSQALSELAAASDLLIEVGPGRVLSGLAAKIVPGVPAIPVAVGGESLTGILSAVAAAHVLGVPVRHDQLSGPVPAPDPEAVPRWLALI